MSSNPLSKLFFEYSKISNKLKIIDTYLFYVMLTGIIQFVYFVIAGSFPFNAFLSGFISTVGCFVLTGIFNKLKKVANINSWTQDAN